MKKENKQTNIHRREFIKKIWIGLGVLASVEIIFVVFNFLNAGKKLNTGSLDNYFEAGPVDSFKLGSITPFSSRQFFLSRLKNGDFIAFSSKCSHLGCALIFNKKENVLTCPCHSSTFDIYGSVLRSPASKSLNHYEVKLENGVVKVNTGVCIEFNDK